MKTNRFSTGVFLLALWLLLASPVLAESMEDEAKRRADGLAIRAAIEAWNEALVNGDYGAMTQAFSEDYFKAEGISAELYAEWLEQSGVSYTESSRDNMVIRFFGNTAIVSSQSTSRGNTGQFGSFSSTSSMTDLWVKQKGSWKCVAAVPDKARQVFSEIQQVSFGPDTQYDVVVLFGLGVAEREIQTLVEQQLSPGSDSEVPIASFVALPKIEEHAAVALELGQGTGHMDRRFFVKRLLKEPIVFRVFEDVVPSKITLGE